MGQFELDNEIRRLKSEKEIRERQAEETAAAKVLDVAKEHLAGNGGVEAAKYPHNVLEAFGNGCLLDLRVRLAIELLKAPLFANVVADGVEFSEAAPSYAGIACHALDIATDLLRQSEARGLVSPLPDDEGLNRQLRLQAARTARYNVWQNMAGARIAAEEQPRVGPVGMAPGRTFNG